MTEGDHPDYPVKLETECRENDIVPGTGTVAVPRWSDWGSDSSGRWMTQDEANQDLACYTTEEIDSRVYIRTVPNKGRCLFSRYNLNPGDVIFIESPILSCTRTLAPKLWKAIVNDCKANNSDDDMPPAWHYASLYTLLHLSKEDHQRILDKWHPPVDKFELSTDCKRLVKNVKYAKNVSAFEHERTMNAWRYNCFGHHSDNHGLVCYDRISMMAHSCDSSATWHYGTEDEVFVLRARKHIKKDEELTITYVGDDDLLKSKDCRRDRLSSWLFVCKCNKCSEMIDKARGIRCPSCGVGTIHFTTDDEASRFDGGEPYSVTRATKCPACYYECGESDIQTYGNFETAYSARIEECSSEDLIDCESVLIEAGRVMQNHYLLYDLNTLLHTGYKAIARWDDAIHHLQQRINFVQLVSPAASHHLAWLYEELGDDLLQKHICDHSPDKGEKNFWENHEGPNPKLGLGLKNRIVRAYETAMNIFLAHVGDTHSYALSVHCKMEYVLSVVDVDSAKAISAEKKKEKKQKQKIGDEAVIREQGRQG